jgi:ABC-2 type transport system ATP-binding protein
MAMRLGFAVAAFLQPDILLVDEVLAVGDATFQQRCLDRMRAVLNEGTTLVFVSHDLASVESISKRGLWLRNGEVAADGPIRESLGAYRSHIESSAEEDLSESGLVGITATVAGADGGAPHTREAMRIELRFTSAHRQRVVAYIGVSEGSAAPVFSLSQELVLDAGTTSSSCTIDALPLPRGQYAVWVAITDTAGTDLTPWHPVANFHVLGADLDASLPGVMRLSPVYVDAHWERSPSTDVGNAPATSSEIESA